MLKLESARLRPRPILLGLLVVFALVAAACGDASDVVAPEADVGDAAAPEADVGDAAAPEADVGDAAPSEADTEGDAPPVDAPPVDNSSGAGPYCELATQQDARDDAFDFVGATPQEAEAYFVEGRATLERAITIAPDQIRADLEVIAVQLDLVMVVFAENNWDVFAAAADARALEPPAALAASDRIDAFDEEVCGLSPDSFAEAGPADDEINPFAENPEAFAAMLESEFGRQQMIDVLSADSTMNAQQATCLIDRLTSDMLFALAFSGAEPSASQLGDLIAVFDECGISPDQFS